MCRVMATCYETLMEDEESQIRGLVHYADGSGVSFPHLTLFTPKEAVRIVKNGEVTITLFITLSKEIRPNNAQFTLPCNGMDWKRSFRLTAREGARIRGNSRDYALRL